MENLEDIYELSPAQQGMLYQALHSRQPELNFQQLSCTLRGRLNVAAFEAAWQEAIDRHTILRTAFVWEDLETPMQVVRRAAPLIWAQHDWRGMPAVEQQERLEAWRRADRRQGFDLSQAPLMRLALIRLDETTHKLIWSRHHILLDGWSMSLVMQEVLARYAALCRGESIPARPGRPFGDYVVWLRDQDLAQAERFWRQTLAGFIAPIRLAATSPANLADREMRFGEQSRQISAAAAEALRTAAREYQLTLSTLVQATWALLLSRYSGESDTVFGITMSGRPPALADVERMVGLFINTLPLRVQVSPQDRLLPWLKQLQAQHAALSAYEHTPLAQIQVWSELPPGLPLFENIVVFENFPFDDVAREPRSDGLEIDEVQFVGAQTNYPLTILAEPRAGLSLQINYDARRFDAATIQRALDDLQNVLERLAVDAGSRWATLRLGEILPAEPAAAPFLKPMRASRQRAQLQLDAPFAGPRTSVEQRLAEMWAELLGLDQVGLHDHFFDLGGHSLLATQIAARVQDIFGVELPLRTLVESPTIAALAAAIAQLKAQHPDDTGAAAWPVIVPDAAHRHEPFPLTDLQQAYWVGRSGAFELGNVASHSYVEIDCLDLDIERFEQIVQRLIARHDMLRVVVLLDGDQQVLEQVPSYAVEMLDLRGHDSPSASADLEAIRQRMSHQVLPADRWPLFEIRATPIDDRRTRLHVSTDALIRDAWSLQILARELIQLYSEPQATLPPLDLSFRDYVLAVNGLRETERYRRSAAYWQNRLATLPPAPELPLARAPGALAQPRFARHGGRLEPEVWQRLKSRAARAGLTPSGILLAAYAEALATWSKSPRFTINLTTFNRLPMHPQVSDIVGDFTSLTLLAVDSSAADPFELRARRLQEQLWDDLDQRYAGGVRVLRELARLRGAAGAGFPVVFTSTLTQSSLQPDRAAAASLGEVVYSITQTPQVWLDHQVIERDGALIFNWDAVEDLFPEGVIRDMFEAYCNLLQHLSSEEDAWQATRRELVPAAQLAQRESINASDAPLADELLHSLFAAQAIRQPERVAIITSRRTITYGDLHRRANRLGHWLRKRGARPNTLVAVVMEKGWEQAAAVLGILASGAAYLPIDPNLPQERIEYLLQQGEVTLALTQPWIDDSLAWPDTIQRLCIDDETSFEEDETPLEPAQGPDDLAYVIYTSGSTGLPKGVMIDHRGAINTILDINRRFNVAPDDRVLALSALNFDLSVYDIFGLLAASGTIVIPDAAATRDPAHWLELATRERVTLWNSVPALMEMLVEYVAGRGARLPAALRLVMLSGDWIPIALPDRIKALADSTVRVISLGGATEASIWSILYPIETVDSEWRSIPYGQPMVNQRMYVLNEMLEPCPVWTPGQLHIGGVGLAKGYWRDEEKTRAGFIIHPWTNERLYRTGDLGRYLPDGQIEFLGREDFQVKIQGHRIELGEIEATLMQHPDVQATVCVARDAPRGNKRLAAYVVPHQPAATSPRVEEQTALAGSLARLEFKLQHQGLREMPTDRPPIDLLPLARDEAARQAYIQRRSHRTYLPEPISFEQISRFLGSLSTIDLNGLPKYRYASAGGLYPVQVYLYAKPDRVAGLPAGTYYYHPVEHRLMPLAPEARLEREHYAPANRPIFDEAAFGLFFVGQLEAIEPMYGQWSRDFCLLEAGLIAQLLEMTAPEQHIGLCQIGRFDFDPIRHWFALDDTHLYLHSLLGGTIDPARLPANAPALGSTAFADELRTFLQAKLPEYMLPSAFVLLDALPLSPNGKVDRARLPSPDESPEPREAAYVAPQTEIEQTIAAIVQQVVGVERVGLHDNFFELGGTSVHLVQVHNRLRESFAREVPIAEMLRRPTVSALAKYFAADRDEPAEAEPLADRAQRRRESVERQRQLRRTVR